jgi:hypothetical protein
MTRVRFPSPAPMFSGICARSRLPSPTLGRAWEAVGRPPDAPSRLRPRPRPRAYKGVPRPGRRTRWACGSIGLPVPAPLQRLGSRPDKRLRTLATACAAHALHDGYTDLLYLLLPIWQVEFGIGYGALALLRGLAVATMAGLQAVESHRIVPATGLPTLAEHLEQQLGAGL